MKPYYEHGGIAIYHGDCRDILPTLTEPVDLVLTDPPYGVNLNTEYKKAQRGPLAGANDYPPVYGDSEDFNPSHLMAYPKAVLWGANYYASRLPDNGYWLIWDKRDGIGYNDQADCELAWTSGISGTVPRIYSHRWNGMIKASEKDQRRVHPTQKPVSLMLWCLQQAKASGLVLDPYMGSGPVLVAAKQMGLPAIGIEIEERYCEIAAKRLAQEVLLV